MKEKLRILHIEDLHTDAELVARELFKSEFDFLLKVVDTEAEYVAALQDFTPDVILCDHSLPSFNSLDALKIARTKNLKVPFVLITATMSEDVAMSVIKLGADDYILKDRLNRLPVAIKNGIEKYRFEKERRDYLEILSANEKRFRALVENGLDAIAIFNIKGKATYVSPSVPRMLGYTETEIKQLGVYEFLHPDDRKNVAGNMEECLQKPGIAIKGDTVRVKHKDNRWIWVETTLTNMLHDPAINGIIDNFHDVTERVISTRAIKDNEVRLADAQNVAKVGSWETDLTDLTTNWSAETYRILGLSPDNLQTTHQRFLNFVHPDDKLKVDTAFLASFESRNINIIEHRVLSKDGGVKFVEERWRIIRDFEGKPVRASGTIQDITERKKAEQAVIDNEAFTAGLIDSLSSNIAVVNAAGTIIKVNKSWNTFALDNNATSLDRCGVGANYFDVCSTTTGVSDDVPLLAMEGIKSVLSGAVKDFYLEYPCHSPLEERWFYMRVKRFESGEPLALVEHQYITERKKAEELVLRSEANLTAIIENTDSFIYSLDRNLRYITFNTALQNRMQEFYGIKITPGYSVIDYIKDFDPLGTEMWLEAYTKALKGEALAFEREFVVGGISTYTKFSIHPMWENGNVIGLSCFVNDITKAKEAEQKILATSLELERTLNDVDKIMNSSLDIICSIDKNGQFVKLSAATEKILGYKPEELVGVKFMDLVCEDDKEKTLQVAEDIISGNPVSMFENCYVHKNGSIIPLLWSAAYDKNEELMIGIAKDATEKKMLELTVETEKVRFQNIFMQAPSCMGSLTGPNHIFETANPLYLELIGKQDIIGKPVGEVLPEIIEQGFIDILDNVYKTGETFIGKEAPISFHNNGQNVQKYLNFIYQASKDLSGNIAGIFFFAIDVTEQVQSRRKIEESEKRFRQIVETAQEGIWVIDEENRTTFVNRKLCEILGYSAEEMMGKTTLFFKDEDAQQEALKSLVRRKHGINETFESAYITKGGKKIWAQVSTNSIFDDNGQYSGSLAMLSDITSKKELQDLLDKTNQVARIGSWQIDLVNGTLYWSSITKEIHEVDDDFVPDVGTAINFYKVGESRDAINRAVQEGIQNGTPIDLQLEIVTAKGNERWVRAIGSVEFVNKVATKLNGSFQDIDVAKRAELEITRLFEEKNSILESIGDAFFAVDKNWKVTYWNTKAEVVLQKEKDYIIGKNLWEEFADAVDTPFYHHYLKAAEENKTTHFEAYYEALDIWCEVNVYPSSIGLSVYFRNINQSKKAEAALKESEKRYRQIVETAQEGIWLVDENDKSIFVNSKLCDILGYEEAEILGKELYYFVDKGSQSAAQKAMSNKRNGESGHVDFRYITKTGEKITANVSANPIFNDDGKYIGSLAMVTDITEKVKLQQELQEEQLRSQHEIMKAVVDAQEKERAGIGAELHDNVNQLLATARLYINICLSRADNQKESLLKSQEYVSEAIEEIRRLSHALVGPTQDRIMGLVPSIQDLILDISNTKNIKVDFKYSTFREERNEVGLKLVVYRIVQEQINNIIKHADASEISIVLKKEGKDLVVIIKDNGKGFDTSIQRRGIGLQNINNRAKLYDGYVQIISSPGNGCEMIIKFKNHAFGINPKAV